MRSPHYLLASELARGAVRAVDHRLVIVGEIRAPAACVARRHRPALDTDESLSCCRRWPVVTPGRSAARASGEGSAAQSGFRPTEGRFTSGVRWIPRQGPRRASGGLGAKEGRFLSSWAGTSPRRTASLSRKGRSASPTPGSAGPVASFSQERTTRRPDNVTAARATTNRDGRVDSLSRASRDRH